MADSRFQIQMADSRDQMADARGKGNTPSNDRVRLENPPSDIGKLPFRSATQSVLGRHGLAMKRDRDDIATFESFPRSHAPRGNAVRDAPRRPRSTRAVARDEAEPRRRHSHAERGNEEHVAPGIDINARIATTSRFQVMFAKAGNR